MDAARLVRISKYLSKHLRHRPDLLGLVIEPGGWVDLDTLLAATAAHGLPITRDELLAVVEQSDKQRFSIDLAAGRIRANQGHSVEVDLQFEPTVPPPLLYHGTAEPAVASILRAGLRKMGRHHAHLSGDIETARRVGARHGRPTIFAIDTAAMMKDGFAFYCSTNGVWLVDHVPPRYLTEI